MDEKEEEFVDENVIEIATAPLVDFEAGRLGKVAKFNGVAKYFEILKDLDKSSSSPFNIWSLK